MTKLLVAADGRILTAASSLLDVGDHYQADRAVLPKHVLPEGLLIVEIADLPEEFNIGEFIWRDAKVVRKALDEDVLEGLRTEKLGEINAWRAQANGTTFPYLDKHIQCDLVSTIDLIGTANAIALTGEFPPDFPGAWKALDNTYIALPTVDDFKPLYAAFTQRGSLNFMRAQELKARVVSATSIEEIDAVQW